MSKVTLRPATREDMLEFVNEVPTRCFNMIAGERDGYLLGVGGITALPNGQMMAFSELSPSAAKHPVALHKAAVRMLAEARARGIKRLYACADMGRSEAAERWLKRLGFEHLGHDTWVWRAE